MLPVSPSASHAQASARPVLRRRLSALTATAVLVVSAVACSSGGTSEGAGASPTVDPYDVAASVRASDGATATSSVSLSPQDAAARATALAMEAPEKPARMSENSPEGAVAAAEYFISLYPYVYATGDLTEWDAMSEESCVFCSSVHDNVTELHENGGWAEPWAQSLEANSFARDPKNEQRLVIPVVVDSTPGVVHKISGDDTARPTQTPRVETIKVQVLWQDGSWRVEEAQTS